MAQDSDHAQSSSPLPLPALTCPFWCSTSHEGFDAEQPLHVSRDFKLWSSGPATEIYSEDTQVIRNASLCVTQEAYETDPRVWLGIEDSSSGFALLPSEAKRLAAVLTYLANLTETPA